MEEGSQGGDKRGHTGSSTCISDIRPTSPDQIPGNFKVLYEKQTTQTYEEFEEAKPQVERLVIDSGHRAFRV